MVAFGVGRWPHTSPGSFPDWTPLLLVLVSLFLIRFVVRLPVSWPTAIVAILAGTAWGSMSERWGILPTAAGAFLLVLVASWIADRIRSATA